MAAERYDDALEFFQRARAHELTRRIAAVAMQAGNTPLYMRAKKVLGEAITDAEWTQLANAAEKSGAFSSCYLAHSIAGHAEEAARVRAMVPGLASQEQPQPSETGESTEGQDAEVEE